MDYEKKQAEIKKVIADAAKKLTALGVAHFVAATDIDAPGGGYVVVQSDINGPEFCCVLDAAFPANQDVANLGVYIGQVMVARRKAKENGKK